MSRRRRRPSFAPSALALGVTLAALGGCAPAGDPEIDPASIGVTAIDADGLRALRLNTSRNLRLVNVWATWCGPCVRELPGLVAIRKAFKDRGLEVVTVAGNYPDEIHEVLARLREIKATTENYVFGTDRKYELIEAFDPEWEGALPYTLLIRPGGEVIFRHMGELDLSDLRSRIEAALKDR